MSKTPKLHGRSPCASCPFRADLGSKFFPPQVLDDTIGVNLREKRHVHRCHKEKPDASHQLLCVGFMRFLVDHDVPNRAFELGVRLGVIDPSVFSDRVPISESWDAVLANHSTLMVRTGQARENAEEL
jgi:hypothetical protein